MGRVTLQTIADDLGVSRTTVSNAFSKPDQLSPALRDRILGHAARVGYAGPDPTARSLRQGSTGALGLLLTESLSYAFGDPYATQLLQGLATATEAAGLAIMLVPTPPDKGTAGAVERAAVDGFCVYAMPSDHPAVGAVLRRKLPTVAIDVPALRGVPGVTVDDRAAARRAAEHLLDLGHRRIGVVTFRLHLDDYVGPVTPARLRTATFTMARDRITGVQDAVRDRLGSGGEVVLYEAGLTGEATGAAAAHALLGSDDPPTAIFTTADRLAVGVLRAAAERGLRVPADLAVAGFDDLPAAAQHDLTSVRQPARDKGEIAGRWLVAELDGTAEVGAPAPPADGPLLLPTTLVVRGSTAG